MPLLHTLCPTPSTSRWWISCTSDSSQSSYLCLPSHLICSCPVICHLALYQTNQNALAETHLHRVQKDYPTTINQTSQQWAPITSWQLGETLLPTSYRTQLHLQGFCKGIHRRNCTSNMTEGILSLTSVLIHPRNESKHKKSIQMTNCHSLFKTISRTKCHCKNNADYEL